jgi:GNAT superfamily N-acetyltransferase
MSTRWRFDGAFLQMTNAINFRRATAEDALCIGLLATQVFLDTYAPHGIRPDLAREALACYSPEVMAAHLADPNVHFMLAESDGHLVAFVELGLNRACPVPNEATAEISRLYVQRNFHRRGIGQALSAHAEHIASDFGHSVLWLTAWSGNAPALAFYARLGYIDIGRTEYVIEGQSYENRVFVKTANIHNAPVVSG